MQMVCTPEFIGYCTCVEVPLRQKKKIVKYNDHMANHWNKQQAKQIYIMSI